MEMTPRISIALLFVAVLAGACFARASVYQTEVTLYADTAAKSPAKARPQNNYGDALKKAGRFEEAMARFERALEIKQDYPDALNNLATVYNHFGKRDEALSLLLDAIALQPDHLQARYNLAMAYYERGLTSEAATQYRLIMEIAPWSKEAAFAWKMLAFIKAEQR